MPTIFEQADTTHVPTAKPGRRLPAASKETTMTPLTSFAYRPDGVKFETQEVEEEVILFLRQHVVFLVPPALLGIILVIAPSVILPFVLSNIKLPVAIPPQYLLVGTLFWYVATFGFLLVKFLRWYFNIYIVSNERIVDIDFVHLLYKEFSETHISRIQDITYRASGIFATVFNFGDVVIQTASELPNFEFTGVPNPETVTQTISELAEKGKTV